MGLGIYFCGSICGGRQDQPLYGKIIALLQAYGTVFTKHVGYPDDALHEVERGMTDKEIYERDMAWLQQSSVVVAEVTQPSLGVGYEIGRAASMKKKILCLFRPSEGIQLSPMIEGAADGSAFQVKHYEETEVEDLLKTFFQQEC